MTAEISPFRLAIPESELDDLRDRLRRTRWPEPEPVSDWSQGVPLTYLRELCSYWATEYDWRRAERELNALPQFRTAIDGVDLHFVHVRSEYPAALPLLLTNGWPSSIVEYRKVIGSLTAPDDPANAFHLVLPALPGYGFSGKPSVPGWGVERIADTWRTLMTRLGYDRYGAVGSDWGTSISTLLATKDADRVAGIHLVPPLAPPDPATFDDLTADERQALADLERSADWESGYSAQQSTRPQTLGYGLVDSPVALCAWIVEKFRAWSDCDGHPENVFTRDELLDNVMLYWLTGTGASSARLYWESIRRVSEWFTSSAPDPVLVPTGCSIFPKEMPRPSRRWASRRYPDVRHWAELDKGGHFAALEQPDTFVRELRTFFNHVR